MRLAVCLTISFTITTAFISTTPSSISKSWWTISSIYTIFERNITSAICWWARLPAIYWFIFCTWAYIAFPLAGKVAFRPKGEMTDEGAPCAFGRISYARAYIENARVYIEMPQGVISIE